jgi:hypothetical protein
MMRKSLLRFGVALLAVTSACSSTTTREAGEHTFDVPRANVGSDWDWPFFLPRPASRDGFSFTLNPAAPRPDQVLVGVAVTADQCARTASTTADINSTVCTGTAFKWRDRPLVRIGDKVFWQYTFAPNVSKPISVKSTVVRCFRLESSIKKGLCTAVLSDGDLTLTLHITDNLVPEMQTLYDRASADLASWLRR